MAGLLYQNREKQCVNWERRWTFVKKAEYELRWLNVEPTSDIGRRKQAENVVNEQ
jgi:hypothetical protein